MNHSPAKYEWDASQYSVQSNAQAAWGDEVLSRLAPQPYDAVLDIGCGDGKITARIAERVPNGRVLGIDSSDNMVRHARVHFSGVSDRLSFEVMDATTMTFNDEFDAVFSNAALHWIEDHRPVLAGIRAALRNGGRACMQMGGRGNAAEVHAAMDAVCERAKWARYFGEFETPYHFYGPDEYREWLGEAGLSPERIELVSRPMRHSREQFSGWLTTTWMPYTSRVPVEERPRFVEEVVDYFVRAYPPDAAGVLTVPMIRLNVDARKS